MILRAAVLKFSNLRKSFTPEAPFLVPGMGFVEDNFPTNWGAGGVDVLGLIRIKAHNLNILHVQFSRVRAPMRI